MQIGKIIRLAISYISHQIERIELRKFASQVFYCLSKILSIWFETINEVDTLKIRKKRLKGSETQL